MLLLLVLTVGWLGFRGRQVQSHLSSARTLLVPARTDVLARRTTAPSLPAAAAQTHTARSASRDRVWALVAHIPLLGDPLRTAAGIAEVSDQLASRALLGVLGPIDRLQGLGAARGSRVPVDQLSPLAAPLTTVDRDLAADGYAVDHLPAVIWIGPLERARASLATELRKVGGPVHTAAAAATIAPDLLGATRPHRYLVVFEQPSETRPDGGLLGGWAVLTADCGALRRQLLRP